MNSAQSVFVQLHVEAVAISELPTREPLVPGETGPKANSNDSNDFLAGTY